MTPQNVTAELTALLDLYGRAAAEYLSFFNEETATLRRARNLRRQIGTRHAGGQRELRRARDVGHRVRRPAPRYRGVLITASDRPTAQTSTFLFTDIEGSTRLIQALGDAYADLLEQHRRLVGDAVEAAGGRVFGSEGDALFAAFGSASSAIAAGAAAQRALATHPWPEGSEIRVRMGIHTGEALLTGGNYVGLALHQVARITSAGHGGQVLVSDATRRLVTRAAAGPRAARPRGAAPQGPGVAGEDLSAGR